VTTMDRRPAALRLGDQVIPLKAAEATTIGRDSSCDVVLPAGFVSRRHAEVVPVEGGYTLRDLGSANGTWVGLTRVQPDQPHYLHDGETIRIAETFLGFAFRSAAIQGSAVRPPPLEFVLQGPNGATPLVQDVINLGRNSENDVVVPARAASRLHAQIQRSGDGMFFLYDMGGTNGTLVNGARITDAHQLHDGDTIELAGIHYQVEQAGLAGRPKAPLTPAALTVAAGASAGLRFLLEAGETRIGRASEPENALVLDDPLVSRRHASITIDDGNAVLRDLGSLGGTQVNGQPLAGTRQLASGDSIQIGQTRLIYQAHDDAEATAPVGGGAPPPTSLDRTLPFPTLRFPPPVRDQLPEVVIPVLVTEVGVLAGQPFPLRLGATVIIGRGSEMQRRENYLALNDGKASRRHARVQATADGTVSVEDLDSRNGTFVNDVRIAGPQPLHEGDRLRIGDTVLRFTTAGAPRQHGERQQ
jgi:pSer/pThr/pTyr-binding forkhead associated (FHA) protein